MLKRLIVVALFTLPTVASAQAPVAPWPAPVAPAIPEADGYVAIPRVAVPPDPKRIYRAVFDATRAAKDPAQLAPGINMAGSELNAFRAAGVPPGSAKFVVVFHGAGLDGILDDAHYRAKFNRANPNLKVLAELKKAGVALFVCGQNLAADHIDPRILSSLMSF